ncbi:Uncharacterised protein [Aggregatibacter aphrophilus]|uniref:Uncharacterized protein n=1 Tax=Aggregatibacter aphrophilus TaxID=732 RepID=A0A336NEE8_AGGAP|nr:Uncharacterised protein [Aggregatibacter aphrophilus]
MKKWLFLALAATFSFSTQAQELTENKEYVVVEGQQRSAQPEVIEFSLFTARIVIPLKRNTTSHKKLPNPYRKVRHSSNIMWIS